MCRPFASLAVLMLAAPLLGGACDRCGCTLSDPACGGTVGITAGKNSTQYRWGLDFSFEYRNFQQIPVSKAHAIHECGRDAHDFENDWVANMRLSYAVSEDLEAGVTQGFRRLNLLNVHGTERNEEDDPALPDPIVRRTSEKYLQALKQLTGSR